MSELDRFSPAKDLPAGERSDSYDAAADDYTALDDPLTEVDLEEEADQEGDASETTDAEPAKKKGSGSLVAAAAVGAILFSTVVYFKFLRDAPPAAPVASAPGAAALIPAGNGQGATPLVRIAEAPIVSAGAASPAAPATAAALPPAVEERLDDLSGKVVDLESRLDAVSIKLESTVGELEQLVAKQAELTAAHERAEEAARARAAKAAKRASAPSTPSEKPAPAAPQYRVYAMQADRVWLRGADGQGRAYAVGDNVAGLGLLSSIDLAGRQVVFGSGQRLSAER